INIKAMRHGLVKAQAIFKVIRRTPAIKIDDDDALSFNSIDSDIVFNNVSFTYQGKKNKTLDNFTLIIPKGMVTALVGPSGSGKSTVVKLLERFYDPDEGSIEINDTDLRSVNLRQYRK